MFINPKNKKEFKEMFPTAIELNKLSLFKFYSFKASRPEFTNDLFINKKIYHSFAKEFNDPFECKSTFNTPIDETFKRKFINHFTPHLIGDGHSRHKANSILKKSYKNLPNKKQQLISSFDNSIANLRFSCFTSNKENLLFWAHYASSHQGFCVEFDVRHPVIRNSFKVNYSKNLPDLVFPRKYSEQVAVPLLTKSIHWSYENEFRSIYFPFEEMNSFFENGYLKIESTDIKSVYLGAKMNQPNKQALLSIIKQSEFEPEIFQAELSESSFKLNFKKVKY